MKFAKRDRYLLRCLQDGLRLGTGEITLQVDAYLLEEYVYYFIIFSVLVVALSKSISWSNLQSNVLYLCGTPPMIALAFQMLSLKAEGLAANQFNAASLKATTI